MPNTSVHFPGTILEQLDKLAAETGVSRNRLIVQACQRTLEERNEWPVDIFDSSDQTEEEIEEIRSGLEEFDAVIYGARKNRATVPL